MSNDVPIVRGVRWGAVDAGIRKRGGLDLGLVCCDAAVSVAAVFTQCQAAAAPVVLSRARAKKGRARAILVNAGCANACTRDGMEVASATTAAVARSLGGAADQVLVASTGVIGASLPGDKVIAALPALLADASEDGLSRMARAIMTTDTVAKVAARSQGGVTIAGCAKGAGMIMPNMATMLAFVATDAAIAPAALRRLLRDAARDSFNAVSVDGDTSTNDSLFLIASGASGVKIAPGSAAERRFAAALGEVCGELARAIAGDGEGATKRIEVTVTGARSEKDADAVARRIANSPLVKTAIHAADANWGRIVAAAGTAGVRFDATRLEVSIGPALVVKGGVATTAEAERAATLHLAGREVTIGVNLRAGRARRTVWTCDFSADYVRINAEYRT